MEAKSREVRLGEIRGCRKLMAIRSPRIPFLANFRLTDNPGVGPSITTRAFVGIDPIEGQ